MRLLAAFLRSFEPATLRMGAAVAVALAAALAIWAIPGGGGGGGLAAAVSGGSGSQGPYPEREEIREAKKFAASSSGEVSFAVIGPDGGIHGLAERRQFSSASVSKAMLLAAYLRSHKGKLDSGISSTLRSMITASDNDAASSIYAIVGDEGLRKVAERAGMKDFEPTSGFWGGAQITAADMARFFYRLDHNLEGPHLEYGKELLANVIGPQRWGIAKAAGGKDWQIWFKGGWRPSGTEGTSGAASHQAALLRYKNGTRVALAVLSNLTPGEGTGGGYSVIEGVAHRLLNPPPTGD